jgi:tetratricopeptide (TPR) repeat protein
VGNEASAGVVLSNLGILATVRGDFTRAQMYLDQALAIAQAHHAALPEGRVWDNLSQLAAYQERYAQARTAAESALTLAHKANHRQLEGFAEYRLGRAAEGLGDCAVATAHFERALTIWDALDRPHLVVQAKAGLARLMLAAGDSARALTLADEVSRYLTERGTDGLTSPVLIYLTCYQVFCGVDTARAAACLLAADGVLLERGQQFATAVDREQFWCAIPAHRTVRALVADSAESPPL